MAPRMKILESSVLAGSNVYSHRPCVRFRLDIGEMEERPSNTVPGFVDGLLALVPTLIEHTCSEGVRGGFVTRLREGTWMGHVTEHVAIEIQNLIGINVSFGKARSTRDPGVYNVVYQIEEAEVGLRAGELALEIVEALIDGDAARIDLDRELLRLKRLRERKLLGPSTRSIVDAAQKKGIPFLRLNDRSFVQLGHGSKQKRIQATIASTTAHLGVEVAGDKDLTKKLLGDQGIPVPKGWVVEDEDDAARMARRLGWPVVVKPLDASHGRGILTNIRSEEELRAAYRDARRHREEVIVERHVEGYDFRVLVVNHRFVAAAQRIPARVIGDGVRTIRELVDLANQDERRGVGHEKVLTRIEIDEMTMTLLERHGMTPETVPAADERVYLKTTANLSTGGFAVDVTDRVHPANVHLAERITRIVGLDIAGIDIMAKTLERPLADVGGAVLEVNAAPGFRMHVAPAEGKPRDVAGAVVEMLFPPAATGVSPTPAHPQVDRLGRIPIISVTGTNGKTTTSRLTAHIVHTAGHRVGLTTTEGVYIGNEMIFPGDCTGPMSARTVLRDPTVDFAVLETARGGLLKGGLGYDWSDVAVVTNLAEDHLGLKDVENLDDLANVKAILVERVFRDGTVVLNAEDDYCEYMQERAAKNENPRIALFSTDPRAPRFAAHVAAGGLGATVEEGFFVLYQNGLPVQVGPVEQVPITFGGKAAFNMANACAAILAAHVTGIGLSDILAGLVTFFPSSQQTPGRYNFLEIGDLKVMLDYAHNPHGFRAIGDLIRKSKKKKAIGILSCPGDRRPKDYAESAAIWAGIFDRFILREDRDLRGREPGEVPGILRGHLEAAGIAPDRIERISNELEALDHAVATADPGDLVVIFADRIPEVLAHLDLLRKRVG